MGAKPEKVTENLAFKGKLGQSPESSEEKIALNPEEGTAIVDHEGVTTKSGYLTFYPCEIPTINCTALYE